VTLTRYCTCGAVLKTTVARRKQAQALSVWYARHSGGGHAETDAAGAEAARMGTGAGAGRETARQGGR
jgi:hypothetical protein